MTEVAMLVYQPTRQRRADNSFDGNDNVGAKVIVDSLQRSGIKVDYCSPATARRYRCVLVSLTSTYDMYAFYRSVSLRADWQQGKRAFRVLAGGFGMQNPTSIRRYIDFAAFGRLHLSVPSIVRAVVKGGDIDHRSVMPSPDFRNVTIAQEPLYDKAVDGFAESFTGCPLRCKFCHYTWARKHQGGDSAYGEYVQTTRTGGVIPELTWDGLVTYPRKAGRVRVAIDGFSERLRLLYGKPILNDDIVVGVNRIGRFAGTTTLLVYNISNMPTETDDDRSSLYATLAHCGPRNRVIFVLHSTPFRPSIATPMQWEPATLHPDWSRKQSSVIIDRDNLRAVHSFTLETSYSHALSVIAERATEETDDLFHAACFATKLNNGRHDERLRRLRSRFDIAPYLSQLKIDAPHPAWFVSGYTNNGVLRKVAHKMRGDAMSSTRPGWRSNRNSIVRSRLRQKDMLDEVEGEYECIGAKADVDAVPEQIVL